MDATFEQVFLALAVRNEMLQKEDAVALLGVYRKEQEEAPDLSIGSFLRERGKLTDEQIQTLVNLARQYLAREATRAVSARSGEQKPTKEGEIIPGYRICGKLGIGGTATVFRATPTDGGPDRALKILHPKKAKDPKQRERFLREANLLTEFRHPNIVEGYSAGHHNGLYYSVMEIIQGPSVQDILDKEKRIEESRALEIILDVAKALDYMHEKGYVHKDIKPGNIMIAPDKRAKICDLGFAAPLTGETGEDDGYTVGTVQFMSPEQAQGRRDVDIRSDIYSLGATLFYMLLGSLPFEGENDMETMAKHVLEELDSSEVKNRAISQHMHYFIERMMSKDKNLRYESPKALIQDITEQIEGFRRIRDMMPSVRPDSRSPRPLKSTRSRPSSGTRPTSRLSRYTERLRKTRGDRRSR